MNAKVLQGKWFVLFLKTDRTREKKKKNFKTILTCTIKLLSINNVFLRIWKKDSLLAGIKINPKEDGRRSCHWKDDIRLVREGEWDATNNQIRWKEQKPFSSCRKKDTRSQPQHGSYLLPVPEKLLLPP